jgi:hypothetical protein
MVEKTDKFHVEFDKNIALARLNELNLTQEIGGDNVLYYLKVERINEKKIRMVCCSYSDILTVFEECSLADMGRKIMSKRSPMLKDLISIFGGDELPPLIEQRLRAACRIIQEKWSVLEKKADNLEENFPDFERPIRKPLRIFGLGEDEGGEVLTEAFWAYSKNPEEKKPILYVLESRSISDAMKRGVSEVSELSEDLETKMMILANVFNSEKYAEQLLPSRTSDWMIDAINVDKVLKFEGDLKEVLNNIFQRLYSEIIPKYIFLSKEKAKILAYWIMGTYVYDVFPAFPILFVWGYYRSGKSRVLVLIKVLGYHGFLIIDPTNSDLFRTKHETKGTICIDENENLNMNLSQADNIINSSYSKGSTVRRRTETSIDGKRVYVADVFETYSPTALASIAFLRSEATLSRTIVFTMQEAKVNPPYAEKDEELITYLYAMRLWDWHKIKKNYQDIRESDFGKIKGRELELWAPFIALAKYLGRDTDVEEIIKFAEENISFKTEMDSYSNTKHLMIIGIQKAIDDAIKGKIYYKERALGTYEIKISDLARIINDCNNWTKPLNSKEVSCELAKLGFEERNKSSDLAHSATFFVNIKQFQTIFSLYTFPEAPNLPNAPNPPKIAGEFLFPLEKNKSIF